MNNFEYCCPTHVVFGKGSIAKLRELIPQDKKVLMIYGGGSIKKNGVYNQVKAALEGAADIFLGQPRLLAEKVQPLLPVI